MVGNVIKRIKNEYRNFCFLLIYVIIYLVIAVTLNIYNDNYSIMVMGEKLILTDGIKEGKYISQEDIMYNYKNNVYYDKVARKLVITTKDNILKISPDDNLMINEEDKIWIDIFGVAKHFEYEVLKDNINNNIYIYDGEEKEANIKKYRSFIYSLDGKIIGALDKNAKINIIINNDAYDEAEKYFHIRIENEDGNYYVAKIEKNKLDYDNISFITDADENSRVIMVTISNKLSQLTNVEKINTLAIEMLRISSEKYITEESYVLPKNIDKDVYAVITNGYRQASFDNNILSSIVSSDTNKDCVANNILEFVNKKGLKGAIIDFKNYKTADKNLIEQYIKELAAIMHRNGKLIAVKMSNVSDYDLDNIKEFVDFVIIQAYGRLTLASNVSGPHSSIRYVNTVLNEFISQIEKNKIILEIAPYSILWAEKAGSVINSEIYNMNAVDEYIKLNNLNTIFDNTSGQNMINYTKGSVTYKMWIEDDISLVKKIELAKDLKGISIYKSGYENKKIYDLLELEEE